jgi:hypothetical protein
VYSAGAGAGTVGATLASGTACPACSGQPNAGTAAISLASGCTGTSTTVTTTGLTSSSGTSYQWESSPTGGAPWTNVTGATTATLVVTPNATLYYRLRTTCANGGAINNTNAVLYTFNGTAPSCPTLTAPANGATNQSFSSILNWTAGTNTSGYDVYLSANASLVNAQDVSVRVSTNQAGTSYATSGLSSVTTYYWRVVPRNLCSIFAAGCTTFSFETSAPVPTLTVGTLTAFSNTCVGTNSTPNSFIVSGLYLTGNVDIASSPGYAYSLSSGGPFTPTLSITASGTLPNTTVFVQFTPTSATTFNTPIAVSSSGAATLNATPSGTGVANPAPPSPVTATPATICVGQNSNLNAVSAGNYIQWYDASTGGTLLSTSASAANYNVSPVSTTTYYAQSNSGVPSSTGTQTFNYTGAVTTWTVPAFVTSINVTARGAQGGSNGGTGGQGAIITGTLAVTPGQVLSLLVGQQPTGGTFSGGGGGSFVALGATVATATPLIVAGGGGGATSGTGGNASTAVNGNGPLPGTAGNGAPTASCGGGGGGFFTSGANDFLVAPNIATGGAGFRQGGAGGTFTGYQSGGFGGGSAANYYGSCNMQGGAGGGYSGGSGQNSGVGLTTGFGGGSFNSGTSQSNTVGNTGNGQIVISWNVSAVAGCVSTSRIPVTLTVGTIPTISAQPNVPAAICGPTGLSTVTATATGSTAIQWFKNGSPLTETAPYSGVTSNTLTITDATVAENAASLSAVFTGTAPGCTITSNAVIFTVATLPASPSPVTATPASICVGQNSNLNAVSAGNYIQWFDAATGGTLLTNSLSGANYNVSPVSTTTYYAQSNTGSPGGIGTQTFSFTGANQTWTVPVGVTSITLDARGAQGGTVANGQGGNGGRLQGTLAVTPGQVLNVFVGGTTTTLTGGFNGGANGGNSTSARGGGGASDVRIGGIALANRVFIAGGGGGGGENCFTPNNNNGGLGGGLIGGTGFQCGLQTDYVGFGGTQSAGGATNVLCCLYGVAGTLGNGGAGTATYGGGGGGGYYGGGGGAYGGGGGGSSFSGTATSVTHTQGFQSGNGQVILSWNTPAISGCVSATRVPVTITVGIYPTITAQPNVPTAICGGTGTAVVTANATGSTAIQWFKNGSLLIEVTPYSGVSSNTLIITDPTLAENGASYTAVYTGTLPGCTVTSNAVTMTVGATPANPSTATATSALICVGQNSNLNAVSAGNYIEWYDAASGGTLLSSSASGANYNVSPISTAIYYAQSNNGTPPALGSQTFNYTGAITTWTVPGGVTSVTINAKGAQGGTSAGTGGLGANMTGTFAVTPGQVLSILAGQQPAVNGYPGGGGGTYVALGASYATSTPLIVAGGGGGAQSGTGGNASVGTSGNGPLPGSAGNGAASSSCGGGGGGFFTSGGNDILYGTAGAGGAGFRQGGAGGISTSGYGPGGFGGGATADYVGSCNVVAGSGGGYSGGSGTGTGYQLFGYGGGSYNAGTSQTNIVGNTGNGQVIISWNVAAIAGCPSATRVPVTITINPTPVIANVTSTICSGGAFTVTPSSGGGTSSNDFVPANTTYTWSAPIVIGITGTAAGASALNISGTATNTTNAPINVVYTVTPTATLGTCSGATFTITVTVNPLPIALSLTGSIVCFNAPTSITSTTSQSGVNYQLHNSIGGTVGSVLTGNGSGLTWSAMAAGTGYYVIGLNTGTTCASAASNAVNVVQNANTNTIQTNLGGVTLGAGDYLWNGSVSLLWENPANWFEFIGSNFAATANVPQDNDRVFILTNFTVGSTCINMDVLNPVSVSVNGAANGLAKDVYIGTGAYMTIAQDETLTVKGNWTNHGTFTANPGSSVVFEGPGAKEIRGLTPTTFNNLTVNKTLGGSLTLQTPVIVAGTLTMTAGEIVTRISVTPDVTNLLTVGTSAATGSTGSITWTGGTVLGPIKRYFSEVESLTQSSGIFPVGYLNLVSGLVSNRNAQVNYTANLGTGGSITAEYKSGETPVDDIVIPNPPGADIIYQNYSGLPAFVNGHMIQNYENEGYWEITPERDIFNQPVGDLNTAQYSLKLRGNNLSAVTSIPAMSQLRMIKSTSHTGWDNVGIGSYSFPADIDLTNGVSDFTITNRLMTGFSWFNIGSGQISWLPVELTNFAANCNEKSQVDIKWSTASEQNSENFIIERSRDLTQWEFVSTVNAAGNSNYNINYSTLDTDPFGGISYYRLIQVDNNGAEKIYGPISVSCSDTENSIIVFPNPTQGNFTVEISSTEIFMNAQLQITDLTGKIIHQRSTNILEGKNQFTFEGLELQLGTYIINLNSVNGKINPVRIVVD